MTYIRPKKKTHVVLPFAMDPKILKSTVGFLKKFFFLNRSLEEKKCIKAFKTEKYRPKEGVEKKRKKKRFPTDRPMFWHLKGNTTFF